MDVLDRIELYKVLDKTATQWIWTVPHFVNDDVDCDCNSILSEGYCGAVASVHFNNNLPIGEGGNDAAPLEEAKANAKLIVTMRALFPAMLDLWKASNILEATDTSCNMANLGDPAAAYSDFLNALSALNTVEVTLE